MFEMVLESQFWLAAAVRVYRGWRLTLSILTVGTIGV